MVNYILGFFVAKNQPNAQEKTCAPKKNKNSFLHTPQPLTKPTFSIFGQFSAKSRKFLCNTEIPHSTLEVHQILTTDR
jgi:hypothetical protein